MHVRRLLLEGGRGWGGGGLLTKFISRTWAHAGMRRLM